MTLAGFLTLYTLHLIAAISPGPAVLMSARTGLKEGAATGFWLACGIGLGGMFWAAAAMSGLALLFKAAPSVLWSIKMIGAAYLCYLAVKMWRSASEPFDVDQKTLIPRSKTAAVWLGLSTQLTNPKTVAMFSAIFLDTVPPHTAPWQILAVLVAVFLNETLWCGLVARIFATERSRQGYISMKSVIDRLFGGLLALLGLKLATTT